MRIFRTMLIAALAPVLMACCMAPKDYRGDVDQAQQQVLVLHANGHQEMIIRVAPFFQSKSGKRAHGGADADLDTLGTPGYLLWVLTVPSKPTGYALANRAIFQQAVDLNDKLQSQAGGQWRDSRRSFLAGSGMASNTAAGGMDYQGLDISKAVTVGPYDITEVHALGMDALNELNRFLLDKGFNEESADHMRYFVENNFTFLCVYIHPPQGKDKLGRELDLEPLQVGFDTSRPYYPGKFSSRQGDFQLRLHLLTADPLDNVNLDSVGSRLKDNYFDRSEAGPWRNLWTSTLTLDLQKAVNATPRFAGVTRWYSNLITSKGFNPPKPNGDPTIWDWNDDVFFTLGGPKDLPGSWYYGDGPTPFLAQANPMILLILSMFAGAVLLAVVGLGLYIRARKQRQKDLRNMWPQQPYSGS